MDSVVKRVVARYREGSERHAVIRKEKGEYCVRSPDNGDWNGGCYPSKEKAEERLREVEFFKSKKGAVGLVTYPEDHVPAIVVPRGGSSCSKAWRESLGVPDPTRLPAPADSYCSDWYTPVE